MVQASTWAAETQRKTLVQLGPDSLLPVDSIHLTYERQQSRGWEVGWALLCALEERETDEQEAS